MEHVVCLKPAGLTHQLFYPTRIYPPMPSDVHLAAVLSMPGLENAHILRPGYAIEYD